MKISREMVNEGLKGSYHPLQFFAFLLSKVWFLKLLNRTSARSHGAEFEGLHCEEFLIPSRHGNHQIRTRLFKPLNAADKLPGMVFLHGGGYVVGSPEEPIGVIRSFIETTPCVVIAPAYRNALESPYPAAFDDCYDTLIWANEHADQLGIIPDKLIVGGQSAGGGLTAAVSLKATDTGDVPIAFQLPIYPMIDDREQTSSSSISNAPVWNSKTNALGWSLYLKDLIKDNQEIPAYAAPARATDYSNLPPTITFVGELEPFRDETVAYVACLEKEGIPVEFKLYDGCYHGFDSVVAQAEISQDARRFLMTAFSDFVDRFVLQDSHSLDQS